MELNGPMETKSYKKYEVAKKQVKLLKDFYGHVILFLVIVPLVFIARFYALPQLGIIEEEEGFHNWLNWNTYIFPLLWLVAIGIHALTVFKPKTLKSWEEKKIKELMETEAQDLQKHLKQ